MPLHLRQSKPKSGWRSSSGRRDWRSTRYSSRAMHVAPKARRCPNTCKSNQSPRQHRPAWTHNVCAARIAGGSNPGAALSVLDRPLRTLCHRKWVHRAQGNLSIKTVDLPTIKTPGRDGRSGNGRWVRRRRNSSAARRQEQSCEGSNPRSDAATASRGTAEHDRPIAEHRPEGNGRCMIGRSAFVGDLRIESWPLGTDETNAWRKTAGMNASPPPIWGYCP